MQCWYIQWLHLYLNKTQCSAEIHRYLLAIPSLHSVFFSNVIHHEIAIKKYVKTEQVFHCVRPRY